MRWLWLVVIALQSSAVRSEGNEARVRGELIFSDRDKGHCVLCHTLGRSTAPFQGDLGPNLDAVAERMTAEALRLRIADSRVYNPDTIMPPYFSVKELRQVAEPYKGKTVLTEQELSDLVVYLMEKGGE